MPGSDKIRVLIVDDIAETRENIRKLLQFEGDVEVTGAARNGREAIELSQELKPDVVIMDINMPDMNGLEATEAIKKKVPFIQIIILSVQSELSYIKQAMVVGARDFLSKPPNIEELSAAIHRAGATAKEEKSRGAQAVQSLGSAGVVPSPILGRTTNGKIIVVYSPKGGVGTTTIATNLAVSLYNSETKVALVDANLQFGDVAVFLNEQAKNTILDLTPRLDELDAETVEEVMLVHSASGIRVLAAPPRPELAEKVTGEQYARLLEFLRNVYSYVVVDTSSYLTDVVLASIEKADLVVLLTTQDIPSIKNVKAFLSIMDGIRYNRQRVIFVMNRYDKRIAISPEKVGESLKHDISAVVPFDERIVVASVNRGLPFMVDNKTQPIGKSMFTLAELIKERITQVGNPEKELAIK